MFPVFHTHVSLLENNNLLGNYPSRTFALSTSSLSIIISLLLHFFLKAMEKNQFPCYLPCLTFILNYFSFTGNGKSVLNFVYLPCIIGHMKINNIRSSLVLI